MGVGRGRNKDRENETGLRGILRKIERGLRDSERGRDGERGWRERKTERGVERMERYREVERDGWRGDGYRGGFLIIHPRQFRYPTQK